jgi:hypothetical protein
MTKPYFTNPSTEDKLQWETPSGWKMCSECAECDVWVLRGKLEESSEEISSVALLSPACSISLSAITVKWNSKFQVPRLTWHFPQLWCLVHHGVVSVWCTIPAWCAKLSSNCRCTPAGSGGPQSDQDSPPIMRPVCRVLLCVLAISVLAATAKKDAGKVSNS